MRRRTAERILRQATQVTLRICIIGNSHIACLKTAWDGMAPYHRSHACTFFGSPGAGMADLELKDTRLVARTDKLKRDLAFTAEGEDCIRLSDFDAFLIVGLDFHVPVHDERLSAAVLDVALRDGFLGTMTHRIAAAIRSSSQAPVYITGTPFKARSGRQRPKGTLLDPDRVIAALSRAFSAEDFCFVLQPAQTLQSAWSTKEEFATAAPRLAHSGEKINARFEHEQAVHMNAEYGRIYLESFFPLLPAAARRPASYLPSDAS